MVQATPGQSLSQLHGASIRALSSLTRRDAAAVRATVRAAGGGFVVEEHDDYEGYLSLLLTPAYDDAPAYLVSGRTGRVDLAEMRGDDLVSIGGSFASIGAAMLVLRDMLAPGRSMPHGVARPGARHEPDAALPAPADDEAAGRDNGWAGILRAIDALNRRR